MIDQLTKIVYARVEFELEFQESFTLKREMVLRLRRELIRIAKQPAGDTHQYSSQMLTMLDPEVASDPYARRLFQKPSPPFVILPPRIDEQSLDAGDVVLLEVLFLGNLGQHIFLFAQLLQLLGLFGFCRGAGRFDLAGVFGLDQSDNRLIIPVTDVHAEQLSVPQLSLNWWVEKKIQYDRNVALTFVTPARLLANNKPLFRVHFAEVFPFILRRVTSMLYAWDGVELTIDAQYLIEAATEVDIISSDLSWHDWRTLDGDSDKQELGGVTGSLVLGRIESDEIMAVIALGGLFNIGKSAAYGCGHFIIDFSD